MRLLFIGLLLGTAVGIGSMALAGAQGTSLPLPSCKRDQVGSVICVIPRLPTGGVYRDYEIRVPSLDVTCSVTPESPNPNPQYSTPKAISCDRLSVDPLKCNDGVFGSLSVFITIRRIEVDTPQRCVLTTANPGYKLTSRYNGRRRCSAPSFHNPKLFRLFLRAS